MLFHGEANVNLDERGRLALPVRFREVLSVLAGKHVVLAPNPHPGEECLFLYPQPYWDKLAKKIGKLGTQLSHVRAFRRDFVAPATALDLDSNGRVVVPQTLRDRAQLKKKAVVVGQLEKIEIWDETLWSAAKAEAGSTAELMGDLLKDIRL